MTGHVYNRSGEITKSCCISLASFSRLSSGHGILTPIPPSLNEKGEVVTTRHSEPADLGFPGLDWTTFLQRHAISVDAQGHPISQIDQK